MVRIGQLALKQPELQEEQREGVPKLKRERTTKQSEGKEEEEEEEEEEERRIYLYTCSISVKGRAASR